MRNSCFLLQSLLLGWLIPSILTEEMSSFTLADITKSDDMEGIYAAELFPQERNYTIAEDTPTLTPTIIPKTKKPTNKPTAPRPTQKPTPGVYVDHKDIYISEDGQQILTGTLTIALFIFMAFEILSPEILFMIALIILMLCQVLSLSETLSGFSNESMITIGTLFLVIGAVEKSHIVDYIARKTFGMTGSVTLAKFRMYFTCFCLSIFFNNTPLVAILMPVVKDWGRVRDVAASQLLMPLSYSVLAGSFVSMIGTSTNLTVQGLIQADRGYSFGFFAPAPLGIPLFFLLLFYQIIVGPYLLPHHKSGLFRAVRDQVDSLIAEVYVSYDSIYVGQSLELMMNSLGIAPSRVIKIRRRATPRTEEELRVEQQQRTARDKSKKKELKRSQSTTGLFDRKYLKEFLPFWKKQTPTQFGEEDTGTSDKSPKYSAEYEPASSEEKDVEEAPCEDYKDIVAPSLSETLLADDIIFISSAQDVVEKLMKSIAGESKGLYILQSNVLSLPGYGSEICECVVSDSNPFLGKKLSEISALFSEKYKVGLIAVRSKDWNSAAQQDSDSSQEVAETPANSSGNVSNHEIDDKFDGFELMLKAPEVISSAEEAREGEALGEEAALAEDEADEPITAIRSETQLFFERMSHYKVSEHILHYGDVVLCVAQSSALQNLQTSSDFFVVSTVGNLPKPLDLWNSIAVMIFMTMMVLVASEFIDMCPAALTVTCVFFIGGWVKYHEIPKLVDLRLLMLMGCSLSFAKAMTKTGLALRIAEQISSSSPSAFEGILFIYAITLVITELISNNAAAALMYPIAVALADELKVSFIPFAMSVLLASTAGFMSPIGYQTHVMVWGPGGYKFRDFIIFGIVPDLIYWIVGCALITQLFPFDKYS